MLNFTHSQARIVQISAVLALALALPCTALAADASKEVSTAAQHAGLAAGSDTAAKVHLHLHHVINCLVGPEGDGFDAKSGNPCDGQGNGAINDAGSDMADRKGDLKDALALAKAGTSIESLSAAQNVAKTVNQLLKSTE